MPLTARFHPGERAVQERAGLAAEADAKGQIISNVIIPGAWKFLADQSMIVLGSWDGGRNPWPTFVVGQPGFVSTRDGAQVIFDFSLCTADPDDPIWSNLRHNDYLSVIAIEFATRRRLRINGRVDADRINSFFDAPWEMTVEQSYPNCPKYIQRRTLNAAKFERQAHPLAQSICLSDSQIGLIAAADTLFVASLHPEHGTDISHRGGKIGFVQIESAGLLRIPDFTGNRLFNTLGNIQSSGVAGLLFVDFDTGRMLQIVGDAAIDWRAESARIERSWTLSIRQVRESLLPAGIEWRYIDASPFNP